MKAISKYFFILVLLLITGSKAHAQTVTFESLRGLQKSENRIVMVFIQTKWCMYCNSMKHSMFENRYISELLKRKFYLVILDGEDNETIKFAGRDFRYKPTGKNTGVHELAIELGTINDQISYPAICFLNSRNEIVYQKAGYLEPAALIKVLETISNN
jgi:thioredoxin-related protein